MKKNYLKELLDDFLLYRRETTSILFLIPVLLLIFYSHRVYDFVYSKLYETPLLPSIQVHQSLLKSSKGINYEFLEQRINPNHLTSEEWQNNNFPKKIGDRIVKFRLKGGTFYSLKDLKQIYDIDTVMVNEMSAYFKFPKKYTKPVYSQEYSSIKKKKVDSKKEAILLLRKFDPNTIKRDQLMKMNFPERVVNNLMNYKEKGGHFYKIEDLKKLYSIDSSFYAIIKDFLIIDKPEVVEKKKVICFNLNSITQEELMTIRGIGEVKAASIVDYRKKLGGSFYRIEQLSEVFGIDSLLYQRIKKQLSIDPIGVKRIYLNTIDYEHLATHPYINYRQARWIIKYRENHGSYKNVDDLLKIKTIKLKDIENILPYLAFD